jgi:hypothetical protein
MGSKIRKLSRLLCWEIIDGVDLVVPLSVRVLAERIDDAIERQVLLDESQISNVDVRGNCSLIRKSPRVDALQIPESSRAVNVVIRC